MGGVERRGDPVIENLAVRVTPFVTTARSKAQAIEALQLLLERGELKAVWEARERAALTTAAWDDSHTADEIMSLAIGAAQLVRGVAPAVAPVGDTRRAPGAFSYDRHVPQVRPRHCRRHRPQAVRRLSAKSFYPRLTGPRWYRIVSEMSVQDATIAGILFRHSDDDAPGAVLRAAVLRGQGRPESAALVEECLHDMRKSWPMTLSEILSFLPWGWAAMEKIYKVRGGEVRRADSMPDKLRSSKYDDGKIG